MGISTALPQSTRRAELYNIRCPCFAGKMDIQHTVQEVWSQPAGAEKILDIAQEALAARTGDDAADAELAYALAGLLAMECIRDLPHDHPLSRALTMCGQLELPEAHRDPLASWESVAALIVEAENLMRRA